MITPAAGLIAAVRPSSTSRRDRSLLPSVAARRIESGFQFLESLVDACDRGFQAVLMRLAGEDRVIHPPVHPHFPRFVDRCFNARCPIADALIRCNEAPRLPMSACVWMMGIYTGVLPGSES